MVVPGDIWPAEDRCEICGIVLGDEVVIQEFADGSLARLCQECAAGAALEDRRHLPAEPRYSIWPEERPVVANRRSTDPKPGSAPFADSDPLEKTRELLMPVTDLIALQGEMQGALERLAASLERFATDILTESQGKTAVETRLHMLERELDKTRTQLQKTEFIAEAAVPGAALASTDSATTADTGLDDSLEFTIEPEPTGKPGDLAPFEPERALIAPPTGPVTADLTVPGAAEEPAAGELAAIPAEAAQVEQEQATSFRIEEVQAAQRYYNESPYTNRIRDVRRSLGKPKANLTRVPGAEPRAIVTIAWDIVWYQYLVDLRRDLPGGHERVVLHREGMDLGELAHYFNDKNAVVNDDGRLDASELEVRLLSDPSSLITEMSEDDRRLLEDATEEIWDQHAAPEFKWDD